jgi:hypothetical protein
LSQQESSTAQHSQLVPMSSTFPQEFSPDSRTQLRAILSLPSKPFNPVLRGHKFGNDDLGPFSCTIWDLLYLSNCKAKESAPLFSALYISSGVILLMHENDAVHGVQFSFNVNNRTKKIIFDNRPVLPNYAFKMFHKDLPPLQPNSPILALGSVLCLGDVDFPADLPLDNTSFLFFLPPKANLPCVEFYSLFKRGLELITSRCPKLKYLFFTIYHSMI